jgi:ribosomal-protein-alanine N-acetyltransferase
LNVSLRLADSGDAPLLAAIEREASAFPWSDVQLANACDVQASSDKGTPPEHVVLIEQNEKVCGFIIYTQLLDEGAIHNIAVSPVCQRLGMARTLLAEVLDVFVRNGASRALLEVRASNVAAQRLYRSFGFELDGVRKNYYPSQDAREDALLMSKLL